MIIFIAHHYCTLLWGLLLFDSCHYYCYIFYELTLVLNKYAELITDCDMVIEDYSTNLFGYTVFYTFYLFLCAGKSQVVSLVS